MDTCKCMAVFLCCSPETITLLGSYTPIQNKKLKKILYGIIYMWNLKEMIQSNMSTKQKQTHRCRETDLGVEERRNGSLGLAATNLYRGWISKEVRLHSTGNYGQHSVTTHNVNEYEKEYIICICITESLCCTEEINTTLYIN